MLFPLSSLVLWIHVIGYVLGSSMVILTVRRFRAELDVINYPAAWIRKLTNSSSGTAPSKLVFSLMITLGTAITP